LKEGEIMTEENNLKKFQPDKTVIRSLALGAASGGGGPALVDVKDGKIIRIRPFRYDWKQDPESLNGWKLQRNGKTMEPLMKEVPGTFSLAYKKRVYSPNRIKYPLKRVDWDPNGERNTQNRGKSKFVRISWDEAAGLVASELKRVGETYGPFAVFAQCDGHGECKSIHSAHGQMALLLEKIGGYTQQCRNADSWEGWYWGAKHIWGEGLVGMMAPFTNVVKDMTDNCEMALFWGCDPETTPWGFVGQFATRVAYFWSEIGIKQIYICPDLNYGAAIHADKWIPILPNTDSALQLAIAWVWMTEGTYDKEYVKTHSVGFDKFADYVLGKEDGIPKTPEWASAKCNVPEWTIKALARKWGSQITSICHYYGGSMIRGAFAHEPARLEVILLGMQGLGKPGVHQAQFTYKGMPRSKDLKERGVYNPALPDRLNKPNVHTAKLFTKQFIPKTLVQQAITSPPITFRGTGAILANAEDQFKEYTYPLPKEEGGTEIHMIWTDSPCRVTCWNSGNETMEALRNPKIECIVAQHAWLENDCLFSDIILPTNTTLEVEDLVENIRQGMHFQSIGLQKHAIDPIGESMSDYEVVLEVAKKMGKYEEVTEGQTNEELMKAIFDSMSLTKYLSWEEFEQKSVFVYPIAEDWEQDPAGLIKFYKDPEANPLSTPSGKLEFYSERLAKHFPDDKQRPPIPKWIESSEDHDERVAGERAKKYPILVMSNHGKWRVHSQCDDITWTREIQTCKVKGPDGYMYEPIWINPQDAKKRDINNGDIVRVYNERGAVLCGAIIWERIMPGVISVDHGARADSIVPGELDRGGAINLISPSATVSRNCVGMATSGYLAEFEKVSLAQMEDWKKKYPEAFEREYDTAAGLRFNAWVEGGMQ